jgi:uroporphyrinogen III methyltransferase/synthase
MMPASTQSRAWRVAITRDEPEAGPLAEALRRHGLVPSACPVLKEAPPADPGRLAEAVAHLDQYAWVICASARAVEALGRGRSTPWPRTIQAAAVGAPTAAALERLGAQAPVVPPVAGSAPLWEVLSPLDQWPGRRVLLLTTPGGRTTLTEHLGAAGARVDVVEAYRMVPRDPAEIRRDWAASGAEALVLASPRAALGLIEAIGGDALKRLRAVVVIGETTAGVLQPFGIGYDVAPDAAFESVADTVARRLSDRASVGLQPGD